MYQTHMKILSRFCLLIIFCSVLEFYKRFLYFLLGFFMMDCALFLKNLSSNSEFGSGFLVFGCFSIGTTLFNLLGLFFMFSLSLTVLQYGFQWKRLIRFLCGCREKSSNLNSGFCSKNDFGEVCESNSLSCKCGFLELLNESNNSSMKKILVESKEIVNNDDEDVSNVNLEEEEDGDGEGEDEEDEEEEEELCDEDQVFNVLTLRKMIKIERRRANAACMELEKERMAAASATEEAMAMILRLQNEKSSVEREAEQHRKIMEHKQLYDQEVIESLRWMVMKHESQRSLLEDQLRLCKQKLNLNMKNDDQFEGFDPTLSFFSPIMDDDLSDVLISSLEMDLPPM